MAIGGLDIGLQLALLLGQGVKVGIRFGVGCVHLVQFGQGVVDAGNRLVDDLLDGFFFVQLRLLGQIAHVDARLRTGFTDVILVYARHNAEQGGFTGTVEAQNADLGAGEEAQGDVFQNLALGRDHLAHAVHGVDVLRHFVSILLAN